MKHTISEYLNISDEVFKRYGILNAFLQIDSHFFVDPHLLGKTNIPEFQGARETLNTYFKGTITLLEKTSGSDIAWDTAAKRFVFKELKGIGIGTGKTSSDGSGIGPKLAKRLLNRADELVKLGIDQPEIFELIGLFEEDFGPDRLSDMTLNITRHHFYAYTQRVAKELNIKNTGTLPIDGKKYRLPVHPSKKKFIIFVPKIVLRKLPIAQSWEDVSEIARFNTELRRRLNQLISDILRGRAKEKDKKEATRKIFFKDPQILKEFIEKYKNYGGEPYDIDNDPKGEISWYNDGKSFAQKYPLSLKLSAQPKIEDLEETVNKIILQFKKNIEVNGLNELLYNEPKFGRKRKNERYSQLLFYTVSDCYCDANNLDISREPNAGSGAVDFKFSNGYILKILVEIKLSSHKNLIEGYTLQLNKYMESEQTSKSAYVVINVNNSPKIKALLRLEKETQVKNKECPKVYIIDGRLKPTASKLRTSGIESQIPQIPEP